MNDTRLTVAISSRALFDLRESNRVYEEEGLEAYRRYQIEQEDQPLAPGEGFPLVKKLLHLNGLLGAPRVEVILLSRNSADTGLRIFNSIKAHNLGISRAAFCGGDRPYRYASAFKSDLFLSTHADDVAHALEHGIAAATLLGAPARLSDDPTLRIAFDGDAVLFSDEAERVFQEQGLDAFSDRESALANTAMEGGPFRAFLSALHSLQKEFPADGAPIRTALVTARGAPAHERVIRTLRAWDVRLDESLFLGGMDKTDFLRAFGADIFFDDQPGHVARAAQAVAAGHVPSGVINS
ncbi:MAG: 5'-nucleotidase [Pseudomonadales bacterium]|nr:5'-nucleotidase [Pseudomonadales bacterium]MCP5185180.1 5'-nucleotidase [Pseudomonadales bacterium]